MASIDTLPSGHYRVRWRDPNGKQRTITLRTMKEARTKKAEVEVDGSRGVWRDPARGKQTLADYIDEVLGSGSDLAPSTLATYETHARLYIVPALGSKALYQITAADVRKLWKELADAGVGRPTINAVGRLLAKILNQAERDDLIPKNPAKGVSTPTPRRRTPRALTLDEVKQIVDALPPRYRTFVITAAVMGLRFGEAAGLRRSSISGNTLYIRDQVREVRGHLEVSTPTKTEGSERAITLPPFLRALLTAHTAWMGDMNHPNRRLRQWGTFEETAVADPALKAVHAPNGRWDPLIFTGPTYRPLSRTRFNARYWKPAVAKAGIHPPPTFHDLRKVPGAVAVQEGTSLKVIQERLGHANYSTTADMYAGLVPGLDAGFADLLEALWTKREEDDLPGDPFELKYKPRLIKQHYGEAADVSRMWHEPEIEDQLRKLRDVLDDS
jgi:integrase